MILKTKDEITQEIYNNFYSTCVFKRFIFRIHDGLFIYKINWLEDTISPRWDWTKELECFHIEVYFKNIYFENRSIVEGFGNIDLSNRYNYLPTAQKLAELIIKTRKNHINYFKETYRVFLDILMKIEMIDKNID